MNFRQGEHKEFIHKVDNKLVKVCTRWRKGRHKEGKSGQKVKWAQ